MDDFLQAYPKIQEIGVKYDKYGDWHIPDHDPDEWKNRYHVLDK